MRHGIEIFLEIDAALQTADPVIGDRPVIDFVRAFQSADAARRGRNERVDGAYRRLKCGRCPRAARRHQEIKFYSGVTQSCIDAFPVAVVAVAQVYDTEILHVGQIVRLAVVVGGSLGDMGIGAQRRDEIRGALGR